MIEPAQSLADAAAKLDRGKFTPSVQRADEQRQEIVKRFPLAAWPELTLERYALGQPNSEETFCRWMEFRSPDLGSMAGGSAKKLIIFKRREKPGWYYPQRYTSHEEAWLAVREAFVRALHLADAGNWKVIDDLLDVLQGPALVVKTLHLYFPQEILPVCSSAHMRHYLGLVGVAESECRGRTAVSLNRELLTVLRRVPQLENWTTTELGWFLYSWADPRDTRRVVKIAPGENARFWDECLAGEYICVGWGKVGDLREFQAKDEFDEAFARAYSERYNGHKSTLKRKSKEVWTLTELEPGDIVIANQGKSRILAIGEVVPPGYEWRPERPEFKHTVHVRWDVTKARDIETQEAWGMNTVAPVSAALFGKLMAGKELEKPPIPVPVDALFLELDEALTRRGQLILYGPPGTGKTYTARRFAVWWLLRGLKDKDSDSVLASPAALIQAERRLTTSRVVPRTWWVVANPAEWSWDTLFKQGRVQYRQGRLKRNYALVQEGDLVVGYQSTPEKRIVALARVSRKLEAARAGDPGFELEPVARVKDGLTYDELTKDPVLATAEPLRFRNQGTLFALAETEAERCLVLLAERNPELSDHLQFEGGIGPLTWLTFHPSYSYEDFIEGFRPVDSSGNLVLRLEDGIFKRVCREAATNPGKRYVVLIDEINRANVAKVFGEIITLLEHDKRGLQATLPQSKQPFTIPPNVFVVGTMNTADRSIKLLDAALRRRFAFIECMPDPETLAGAKVGDLALDDFLDELNRRVAAKEGREKQIGHSFLLQDGRPVTDAMEFARRFRQEILPLLQEYCYDEFGTLAELIGEKLVDREGHALNAEVLNDTEALIDALEEEFGPEAAAE